MELFLCEMLPCRRYRGRLQWPRGGLMCKVKHYCTSSRPGCSTTLGYQSSYDRSALESVLMDMRRPWFVASLHSSRHNDYTVSVSRSGAETHGLHLQLIFANRLHGLTACTFPFKLFQRRFRPASQCALCSCSECQIA